MRIIFGTDFSENAACAGNVAAALAQRRGDTLLVVYALEAGGLSRDAVKAIIQAAERFGAHLLALGSHGRSGVSKACSVSSLNVS